MALAFAHSRSSGRRSLNTWKRLLAWLVSRARTSRHVLWRTKLATRVVTSRTLHTAGRPPSTRRFWWVSSSPERSSRLTHRWIHPCWKVASFSPISLSSFECELYEIQRVTVENTSRASTLAVCSALAHSFAWLNLARVLILKVATNDKMQRLFSSPTAPFDIWRACLIFVRGETSKHDEEHTFWRTVWQTEA